MLHLHEVADRILPELHPEAGADLVADRHVLGGGEVADPDLVPEAPEERLVGELPGLDVRREDDDLVERDLELLSRPER